MFSLHEMGVVKEMQREAPGQISRAGDYALAVTVSLTTATALMPSAQAAHRSTSLPVSVRVVSSARVQTEYQLKQLHISRMDVTRGYVDVPAGMRFSVATNSRDGYLLQFHSIANFFESVFVSGLGNTVHLNPEGGAIVQRVAAPLHLTHDLNFRFTLSPDLRPGLYPWPLQLSVRPL